MACFSCPVINSTVLGVLYPINGERFSSFDTIQYNDRMIES
ncbi:hypothetical protein BFG60_4584 [Microcystis aeruginosa NIES-98]|uniref:Uncharacterized protein n=1 Tax=Microcystis aeruginosa PCC 7806SL TaxID=1903187 RepID=A0AB33BQ25_MICA7|nr:hypothetical protein BH695_3045 [Microcystis aeruginosa PCC 7806SL]ELS46330.1 hypothetical protein C789_3846 [Microcystis aeruginosa FACHB-905 = DIANCHI905]ODV35834.1 hypothetical protein BFG60_4584 [Microcystis aeruginosa NIES-98]